MWFGGHTLLNNVKIEALPDNGLGSISAMDINLNENKLQYLGEDLWKCQRLKVKWQLTKNLFFIWASQVLWLIGWFVVIPNASWKMARVGKLLYSKMPLWVASCVCRRPLFNASCTLIFLQSYSFVQEEELWSELIKLHLYRHLVLIVIESPFILDLKTAK